VLPQTPFPIPYQGSKRKLAPAIIGCFPPDAKRLIEPFCGSAAVALASAISLPLEAVLLNDNNAPLVALWQRIVNDPEGISEDYRKLWNRQLGQQRAFYDWVRSQFNRTHRPEYLLYLLARCVKASVRYNAQGEFNQSPDNRRLGCHPHRMEDHIIRASAILRGRVHFSSVDFVDILKAAQPNDIVYMDPPYQGVSTNRDRRYRDVIQFDSFVDALQDLNNRDISYIVSYDGRTGDKSFGKPLPETLHLAQFELAVGRSTQATLLGMTHVTYEALYLSPALMERTGGSAPHLTEPLTLFPI